MHLNELPDVLEEALAHIIVAERKEWTREREVIQSESRAMLAELKAQVAHLEVANELLRVELRKRYDDEIDRLHDAQACVKDGAPGKDADEDAIVERVLKRIPEPQPGESGKDADQEGMLKLLREDVRFHVRNAVAEAWAELPPPEPGRDADEDVIVARVRALIPDPEPGKPGTDADMDLVERLINELVDEQVGAKVGALPVPEPGRPGADCDMELVERIIGERIAALPEPKKGDPGDDGKDGKDGKDADPELVALACTAAVQRAIAAIPVPKDGRDGVDGKDGPAGPEGQRGEPGIGAKGDPGPEGRPGRDAADIAGAFQSVDGKCLLTVTDGRIFDLGTIRGKDGLNGKDGISAEDLNLIGEFDGDRTLTIIHDDNDRRKELVKCRFPVPIHRGLWIHDKAYEQCDCVTYDGSTYQALKDTTEPPKTADWRLIVKRGQNVSSKP